MRIKNNVLLFVVLACMMLSACRQHHVHMEEPAPTTAETVESAPEQTVSAATLPAETTVPETQEQTRPTLPEPEDHQFVCVTDWIPDMAVELKYAAEDNFTGKRIYSFETCYLRYGTVRKLMAVQAELAEQGLFLKLWDGFRPVSAQFALWEICPDPTYVANPETGYSSHSRGNTVDITMVDAQGREVMMPTGFDDFSTLADRDYSDCPWEAAKNALFLQEVMENHGFTGYFGEWWHFSDTVRYDVETVFDPSLMSKWYAQCQEFISLRTEPSTAADMITRIPVGGEFTLLGYTGDFSMVSYEGMVGYVLTSYTTPVPQREDMAEPQIWMPNCEEYITLRKNTSGEFLDKIPVGKQFELLDWTGAYAEVEYEGKRGYVLSSYIQPASENYLQSCLDLVRPSAVYSYTEMKKDLEQFSDKYPGCVELDAIGISELGKEIPVLRIGDADAEYHVLLQGAIHGREHMTAWLLVALADYWMEQGYEKYPQVCFHVIPMVNPDGVAVSQTQMLNEYQKSLYSADLREGYTDDTEPEYAALWKANGLGVDLNRNFPAGWELAEERTEPSSMMFRGEEPFSAAESAALRDYTLLHRFDATVSYHASGCVIYWEYGSSQPVNDESYDLALRLQTVTGYLPEGSEGIDGAGYKDWVMDDLGIPSVTVEIGCGPAPLEERELYAAFARNAGVFEAIAKWLVK